MKGLKTLGIYYQIDKVIVLTT